MIVLGQFEVERPIGRGGNATVWRGRHAAQRVPVAVKVMTAKTQPSAEFRAAFFEEVRSVARLRHPGIVTVLDIGEVGPQAAEALTVAAGSPYLVMELVEPGALGATLLPDDWATTKELLLQLLDALGHAHARGVIHRDIKRDNVLVSGRLSMGAFEAKLTDFGLARIYDDEADSPSRTQQVSGTPRYMAPEQIMGKLRRQGPWTDLYSLGCVAWALVTGSPPFVAKDRGEILVSHIRAPLPELRPRFAIPAAFLQWVQTMLAKTPEQRFQRAADAAFALRSGVREADGVFGASPLDVVTGFEETVPFAPTVITDPVDAGDFPGPWKASARPPIPESWRVRRPALSHALFGAGLGLFGLRTLPLVGRDEERGRLWEILREVQRTQKPRVLALRGAAGAGKSRLARWLCERSHEVGAATHLRASFGERRATTDGLEGMLRRHLRASDLSFDEVLAEMTADLTRYRPSDESIRYDAMTLARMVAPTDQGYPDPAERTTATANFLYAVSQERPVVLWIDDAHRAEEPWRLVAELMGRHDLPILVLCTARDDSPIPTEVEVLDVGPLSQNDHRALIDELLSLDDELADELTRRTMGNPLFAVQLVGDWVERGVVSATERGFTVDPAQRTALPTDLVETLLDRLTRAVSRVSDDRDAALTAVIVAACLGRSVARAPWRDALERANLAGLERVEDVLLDSGIVVPEDGGFTFAHDLIVDALTARGSQSDTWPDIHRACADALVAVVGSNQPEVWRQIAEHREESGELGAAIDAWYRAAQDAADRGDYGPMTEAVDRHAALLKRIGATPADRRVVENWTLRCVIAGETGGKGNELTSLIRKIHAAATAGGWDDLMGRSSRLLSTWSLMNGRLPDSEKAARDAFEAYRRAHDYDGMARAEFDVGIALLNMGKTRAAAEHFDRVREAVEPSGDLNFLARAVLGVGQAATRNGDITKAREMLERAVALGEELGSRQRLAMGCIFLGDVERAEGDLDAADRCFATAQAAWRSAGNASAAIADLKRVWIAFERGSYNHAAELERIRSELETNGRQYGVRYAALGLSVCAARAGDFGRWEIEFESARWMIEESRDTHHDLVFLALQSAAACEAAGSSERAERARALAEEIGQRS